MKLLYATLLTVLIINLQAQTEWTADKSHSNIIFSVQHMGISEVQGKFLEYDVSVTSPGEDFNNSNVSFTADISSIDTNNERRDGHLQSDDFFNAEKYPQLTFQGKLVEKENALKLVGDLTIRDVTKKVTFDAKHFGTVQGRRGKVAGFKVLGVINRFDYNLRWDNKIQDGTLVAGSEIEITANVELNEVTE